LACFQRLGLVHRGERSSVDAHGAQHPLAASKRAQYLVQVALSKFVASDHGPVVEPGQELALVADDQPLRHSRCQRQDPPPHRPFLHGLGRVRQDPAEHLQQHDRFLDVHQSRNLVRVVGGPEKSGRRAHVETD
jgi:hypothetical protein